MGDNKSFTIDEGIIEQIYPQRHSARVYFPDRDNLVSAELPVLTGFAGSNSIYMMPEVNEKVVCVFSENDDSSGTGFIIGARYDDKNIPKADSENITRIDFKDGSFIEFDRQSGDLNINCKGDIKINGRNIFLN